MAKVRKWKQSVPDKEHTATVNNDKLYKPKEWSISLKELTEKSPPPQKKYKGKEHFIL